MEEDPVMRNVKQQLAYMTESLNLTPQQQRQWFFRLRREERELQKQQQIQEKINAKKAIKKMVKKLKLPQMRQIGN